MSASTLSADMAVATERARLRAEVAVAARIVAPAWPLETFIAVNPLGGLEDRPFAEAIRVAGEALGARGTLPEPAFRELYAAGRITDADLLSALLRLRPDLAGHEHGGLADLLHAEPARGPERTARTRAEWLDPDAARRVDGLTAGWFAAFLDAGQAAWPMPGRERGFFAAWRDLAHRDRSLSRSVRDRLRAVPERAEDAALAALADLRVPAAERRDYLTAHLTAQPGWAGHVRWRAEHGEPGVDLVDLLAVRLTYEAALLGDAAGDGVPPAPPRARPATGGPHELPAEERALIWQAAYEGHFRDDLLGRLAARDPDPTPAAPATAQLVCCIDVRSEGLRRHFEALGPYETLGFAGFFAVAIRFQDLAGGRPSALCPVLLEPRAAVRERPAEGSAGLGARRVAGQDALASAEDGFHAAKDDHLAPFALAEAAGWAAGPLAAAKTFAAGPYAGLRARLHRRAVPDAPTVLDVEAAFPLAERCLFAEVALRMMGLTRGFGRLVVLCGHGSTTENNPYAAALDCGACGGNRGGPNARTAAAILNGAEVREHLRGRGIAIPDDTVFVAAEHDTATDRVAVLDRHLVPASHGADLDRLAGDLDRAGERLSEERADDLPGAPRDAADVRERSADWAQVFPEWGLAGNAAFIVGPRAMTRGVRLGRRAFLHSYAASADPDGSGLETILTAPLVVAQWINCQYYFSTVEPAVLGAGTKTIHNVVGGVGVLAGRDGDLRVGLPWQSVADGQRLVHEPLRLLAVVQAPLARIDDIVARNPVLQRLFGNDWVALAARERAGERWQRFTADGWRPWHDEEER